MNEPVHPRDVSVAHACRFCGSPLDDLVVDLGVSPLCESFLRADQLDEMEPFYPLRVMVCARCFLVQLPAYVTPEAIFSEYFYFSSYSDSWLEHARRYADEMRRVLDLGPTSLVVELGSNDGYLLRNFVAAGVPVLGIEPARNIALVAEAAGVPTLARFFGHELARELSRTGRSADLIACNNTLAQVPDLNDFMAGIATLLAPDGLLTIEVPHLLPLLAENQFDTIYHEHFSYFSLGTLRRILARHGLEVVDVDELPTHGGSLRVHGRHVGAGDVSGRVEAMVSRERVGRSRRRQDLRVLRRPRGSLEAVHPRVPDRRAARRQDDRRLRCARQGEHDAQLLRHRPGAVAVHRGPQPVQAGPIHARDAQSPSSIRTNSRAIDRTIVWVLPWNLRDEIAAQLSYVRDWGGRLFVAMPTPQVLEPGMPVAGAAPQGQGRP